MNLGKVWPFGGVFGVDMIYFVRDGTFICFFPLACIFLELRTAHVKAEQKITDFRKSLLLLDGRLRSVSRTRASSRSAL